MAIGSELCSVQAPGPLRGTARVWPGARTPLRVPVATASGARDAPKLALTSFVLEEAPASGTLVVELGADVTGVLGA